MSGNRTCNACNKEFTADSNIVDQKLHYKSDWHRYNLKRKIAGLEGITEDLFLAKLQKDNKLDETPMLYTCGLCCKSYKSPKAHAQHLTSKSHLMLASRGHNPQIESAIIRPLMQRISADDEDADSFNSVNDVEDECEEELDPTRCFMCDLKNRTLEACMLHMHKKHGLFIPDIEYLKDPKGLLTYFGLKVTRDLLCLYCNESRNPFSSLEAVRKHMEAKGHCKVDEKLDLEELYDYSSTNMNEDGKKLGRMNSENCVEFGSGGCEIILKRTTNNGSLSAKKLGSREYKRYYKQNPVTRPRLEIVGLASRFKSMEVSTIQPKKVRDMRLYNMHQSKIARSLGFPTMQSTKKVRSMTMRTWKMMRGFGKDSVKLSYSLQSNYLWLLPRNSFW